MDWPRWNFVLWHSMCVYWLNVTEYPPLSFSLGMAHSILCTELLWALWPEQMFNPQESLALFLYNFSFAWQSPLCPHTSFPGTEPLPFQQTGNQKQWTCCSRRHVTEEKGSDSKQGWFCQQPVVPWDFQTALALSLGLLWKGNLELLCWEVGIAFRIRVLCPREWESVWVTAAWHLGD